MEGNRREAGREMKGSWKGGKLEGRIHGGQWRRAGKEQEGRRAGWKLKGKGAGREESWWNSGIEGTGGKLDRR